MSVIIDPYWDSVLAITGINVLLGLGLYLTMLSGQVSAAHSALGGVAGYLSGYLSMEDVLPPLAAMAVGVVAATLLGVVIAYPVLRLRGLFLAIATLGFSSAAAAVIVNISALGGPAGMAGVPIVVEPLTIIAVLIGVVVWFLLFDSSLIALSFRAIRDNELAAAASGISIPTTRIVAFGLGAFVCAVAGSLNAHYVGVVTTADFSFGAIAQQITFVGLGGSDVFLGPIVGAGFFSLLPEALRFASDYRLMIFAAVAIIVITWRPQGLLSRGMLRGLEPRIQAGLRKAGPIRRRLRRRPRPSP